MASIDAVSIDGACRLDVVAFRSKNKRWAQYVTYINDTRYHKFGLRDLGRGLTVLYEGKEAAPRLANGIKPTFTPKKAQKCFDKTGVFPFNPQRIDRSHLRPTLEMPKRSEHEDELMRDGPAVVMTQRRIHATKAGGGDARLSQVMMERDEEMRKRIELEEELKVLRAKVLAPGKDGAMKEVKGEFGFGLCTSEEITEGLQKEAEKQREKHAAREAKKACRPNYVNEFKPRDWHLNELKEQCIQHGVVIEGMKLRAHIWAAYLAKFPEAATKKRPAKKVPDPESDDSESECDIETETESESESASEPESDSKTDDEECGVDEEECGAYWDWKEGPNEHDSDCTCDKCVKVVDESKAYHRPSKRFRRMESLDEMH